MKTIFDTKEEFAQFYFHCDVCNLAKAIGKEYCHLCIAKKADGGKCDRIYEQFKEEKQQWIMKAKEWLHDNATDYISYTDKGEIAFNENGMVINFAKAMGNEL